MITGIAIKKFCEMKAISNRAKKIMILYLYVFNE
ncbi:hypothetical protein VIBHAR_06947 [Vibrio campbellii ATCC BAA-1116]|uniref:Uncharacterized protein n=1 Tax=Vibrio campbellii (strain ATCC BAA-1116) TaxID=2902295 RepID=A7N620_VIBC1|nr:hypothetical protein VIBHAR_06947 [Vibrio campbellii ATCC BAA-1116]